MVLPALVSNSIYPLILPPDTLETYGNEMIFCGKGVGHSVLFLNFYNLLCFPFKNQKFKPVIRVDKHEKRHQ